MRFALPLLALCLAGCSLERDGPGDVIRPTQDVWRAIATDPDRERLRDWRDPFTEALTSAKKGGAAASIAGEGLLLAPDAALPSVAAPAGEYRCRRVKVGRQDPAQPVFFAYPAVPCRIAPAAGPGAQMLLEVRGGPQRPVGRLFPETNRRMVFLGTVQIGDERGNLQYGTDLQRDMAGFLERIGERRWRLLLPEPHFESLLDVVEIVPAS